MHIEIEMSLLLFFFCHDVTLVIMKTHDIYNDNIIRSLNPIVASAQVLWVMNESQKWASH